MGSRRRTIPISAAERIAHEYGIDQVVILGRCPESEPGKGDGIEYVTTYGRTKAHCEIAAKMGEKLKTILDWPPFGWLGAKTLL